MSDISHLVNGNKNREARVDKIGADRLNSIVERIAGVNPSKLAAKAEGGDANHRPDAPMAEAAPSPAQVIRSQSRMAPQPLGNQPDPRVHYLIDKVARLEEKLAQYEVFNGNDNDPVVVANRPGSRRENANRGPESRVFARPPDPNNTRPDPGDGEPDAPDTKNATEEIMSGNHINILGMSMTEWREMAGVRKPIIDLTESQYVESRGMGMDEATPPRPPAIAFINAANTKRNYLKNVFRQAGTPHPDDDVDAALADIKELSRMTRTGNKSLEKGDQSLEDIESQIWSNILYSIGTTPDQFASFVEEADANNDEDALLAILDLEDEFVESVEYYLETAYRFNPNNPDHVAAALRSKDPKFRENLLGVPDHVLRHAGRLVQQQIGQEKIAARNAAAAAHGHGSSEQQQKELAAGAKPETVPMSVRDRIALAQSPTMRAKGDVGIPRSGARNPGTRERGGFVPRGVSTGRIKGLRGGGEQTSAMEVQENGDEGNLSDDDLARLARGRSKRAIEQAALLAAHLANNPVKRFAPGETSDPQQREMRIRELARRQAAERLQALVASRVAELRRMGAHPDDEAQKIANRIKTFKMQQAARKALADKQAQQANKPPAEKTPAQKKTDALRDRLASLGLKSNTPKSDTPKSDTPLYQSMESVWYEWLESMGISAYGYNALVENADSEDDLILIEGLQALFEAEFDFRKVGGGVVTTTPVATRGTTRGGTTRGGTTRGGTLSGARNDVPEYFECGSDADGNPDLRDPVWNKYLKKHSKARKEAMSRSKSRINKLKKYIKKSKSGGRR